MDPNKRLARWYFGGLASAGAALVTHPLDLLKVHLQTQQERKLSATKLTIQIISKQGVLSLYTGLTASLLRQLTYSTTRFGIYEFGKQNFEKAGQNTSFYQKLLLSGASGAAGGIVGTPADLINVRMQNDVKLPQELRRNYRHAFDGLIRVWQEEGFRKLFSGCSMATGRATLMTIGQLSFYDQTKIFLLQTGLFADNPTTHVVASSFAGAVATTLTQPLDVLKTRAMNAQPGEFKSLGHLIVYTAKLGPLGFFKGYVPAFIRLAPHTILTFLFLEQLRSNFGFYQPSPA